MRPRFRARAAAVAAVTTLVVWGFVQSHVYSPSAPSSQRVVLIPAHPFYGHHELCGSGAFLVEYARVHALALNASPAGPLLVSISVEAGLGDRIIGVMSEFYWALLSRRALLLTAYADGTLPRWDYAVDPVLFDWRAEESAFPQKLTAPLHYTYVGMRGWPGPRAYARGVADPARDAMVYQINGGDHIYEGEDLSQYTGAVRGAARERLFVASNRGGVVRLFSNPHHAGWLSGRATGAGLLRENAWACGFRALFSPGSAVLREYGAVFERLRAYRGRCVAVNVRAGDAFLSGEASMTNLTEQHEAYFSCAKRAAREAFDGGVESVPWYVTSDSPDLRRLALERWGPSTVVTDPVTRYVHGDCLHHGHPCTPDLQRLSIVHAFGQLFAATLCSAHVFSGGSGFGRSAAFATPATAAYVMEVEGLADCTRLRLDALAELGARN